MRSLMLAGVALTLTATSAFAQAGARRAAPSTRAIAEMSLTFADTAAQRAAGKPALVRIDYGQPHLRGRKLRNQGLAMQTPYGQRVRGHFGGQATGQPSARFFPTTKR